MHPARRRAPGYGLLLLAYQVFAVIGVNYIPPVTLALVALHSAVYLRLFQLPWYKPAQVCVSLYNVWYREEYFRLLYAAFEHGDDWHLYYNMVSFILKGKALERRFGSVKFLYLILTFSVLTNATLVCLSYAANEFLEGNYISQCAIGFSGVIFALKVLTTYHNPSYTHQIMGIPVMIPAKYAVWAELVLIQLLVPNVSFLGHLAGILVGLAYIKGPLGQTLDAVYSAVASIFTPSTPRFQPHAEPSGYRTSVRYAEFAPEDMDEQEQLRRAMEASLRENVQSHNNLYPDFNDIRRRRLEHF